MGGKGRLVGMPREPSVAGMLLSSAIAGVVVARPIPLMAAAAISLTILHLVTFDPAMDSIRSRDYRRSAILILVNGAPYAVALTLDPGLAPALAVASAILVVHLVVALLRGWRDPITYIVGSAVPVLPGLLAPAIAAGSIGLRELVLWGLLTLYSTSTSAYVESRLEYRALDPRVSLALWAPSYASIAFSPWLALVLVEPTVKMIRNVARNVRVSRVDDIKRMGRVELFRFITFISVTTAILYSLPAQ